MDESLQKEKQIVVDPMSLKEATLMQPPPLPPPKLKFLSSSLPNSANSSPRCQTRNQTRNVCEGRASVPCDDFDLGWLTKRNTHRGSENPKIEKHNNVDGEGFKCSALCLYLPGFGKAKAVKERKQESVTEGINISRTVSLEKFECGSWSSSAIIREIEAAESDNSYFDLPLELIKCSADDAHSPITAAFVFDKEIKGILKNGRKSDASPRHVRFSVSSSASHPASPAYLRKTKEEFNAFLEAQTV
ncbi:hypothetical protein L6164_017039 [Bauhinia variegata]|uniref:Uncharacterized protein n=1 Tax=Bauhinia variegata TaxID=167791 RepID=A0ACB9N863_BAUVA|nr:hypothetical protein L6164_017039 [Bauhinia variegata]